MTIKFIRHQMLTLKDDEWCDIIAEKYFHASEDPRQATAEECSFDISKMFPYAWTLIKDRKKRVGYTYILPATYELMQQFLEDKLTECQAMQAINERIRYENCDAAYLAGAVIVPEYQRKGLIKAVTNDTLMHMDKASGIKIKDLYVWSLTKDTDSIVEHLRESFDRDGRTLHIKYNR